MATHFVRIAAIARSIGGWTAEVAITQAGGETASDSVIVADEFVTDAESIHNRVLLTVQADWAVSGDKTYLLGGVVAERVKP